MMKIVRQWLMAAENNNLLLDQPHTGGELNLSRFSDTKRDY